MKDEIQSTLNLDQNLCLDKVLEKQTRIPTPEFKNYCNQFTVDIANEGYDIAHDIMKHLPVCLEAPNHSESNESDLERTYAVDTTIYIVNCLFRMHQDILERMWLEILTKDTKNRKIDGALKELKSRKKEHQTICIVEFSYGKKAPDSKETGDDVKLARNLWTNPYTIYGLTLPSVYLYDELCALKSQPPLMTWQ